MISKQRSRLSAQPRARGLLSLPYRVKRSRLPNGLKVATVETPYLHSATVALYVRAGSRYETPATNGLSHFVEHMLFRGSARFPDSYALNLAIEERGGMLYAETGRDYSLYQISLHPREVPAALTILGDLFTTPTFDDIERERSIILEEILEDLDDRGRKITVDDIARESAWPRQPLGFSIIGPTKNVRRFTTRDVRGHFQRLYGARNMALCIAGRVDPAEVRALAARAFARVPPGRRVVPVRARPSFRGPRFRCVWNEAAQTQLQMLFYAFPDWDKSYPALAALLRLVDDGMSTPLHYQVCDQKGLAYNVGASLEPFHDTALLEVDGACAHAKVPELVEEIFSVLDRFRTTLVSADALDKAKRRYLGDLEAGFDDLHGLCSWFGGADLFLRAHTHDELVARMQKVTAEQVRNAARRVLMKNRLTTAVVGMVDRSTARRTARLLDRFGN
jgi:predicted Zn-dependent peptidase